MTHTEACKRLSEVMRGLAQETGPSDRWFELRAERAKLERIITELER
jgi:hypothetical protein